jgi:hypothetical protein
MIAIQIKKEKKIEKNLVIFAQKVLEMKKN